MSSDELLVKAGRALRKLVEEWGAGRVRFQKEYQKELLREVLLFTAQQLENFTVPSLNCPYRRVFVLLPSNVPHIALQLLPLIASYRLETFFKLPSGERLFMKEFLRLLDEPSLQAGYLDREETARAAAGYDFLIGFGSSQLEEFLKNTGKPFRFFGPRFSFAYLQEGEELGPALEDGLSFDTEGCLSTRFIFVKGKVDMEHLYTLLQKAASKLPPQSSFNFELFDYYNRVNLYYADEYALTADAAVIKVRDFPEFFPPRTLFIVEVKGPEQVLEFLGERANSVQAVTTPSGRKEGAFEKTSASLFLPCGRSQFPPLGWMFEKGLSVENFFS